MAQIPWLLLALALLVPVVGSAAERPHIVVLLADDLGWKDVGFHGSEIATPNLDRLAAEGARFEQLYAQPLCSPSRAALLTGRYPMRSGLQGTVVENHARYGLPPGERSLATALRDAGYATFLVGKWHLGSFDPSVGPRAHGFQHHYGNLLGWVDHFTHRREGKLDWYRDGAALEEKGYTTELLAAEALRVLRAHDPARPLFLMVSFLAPHFPLQAPAAWVQRAAGIHPADRRLRAAMVMCLDDAVGRIVAEVERRGMREDTLVLFASDNGGPTGPGQAASNGPWRDGKPSLYEGGVRVAALANWPGRIPAGRRVGALLHFVDLHATLLRLAGVSKAPPFPLDGRDAWGAIAEAAGSPREELLLDLMPSGGALRQGNWKLVVRGPLPAHRLERVKVELYDLASDPGEQRDLREEESARARDMLARLDAYAREAPPPLR